MCCRFLWHQLFVYEPFSASFFSLRLSYDYPTLDCGCGVGDVGSGSCDSTGNCSCQPGFADAKCTVCSTGYYLSGSNCVGRNLFFPLCRVEHQIIHWSSFFLSPACQCSVGGSVNSSCSSSGVCTCNPGVTGETCNNCVSGTYGADCQRTFLVYDFSSSSLIHS